MSAAKRPRTDSPSPEREKPAPDDGSAAGDTIHSGPAITEDSAWTTGDFEVVTSDHVRFRVRSHYLLSASAVFRDAEAMAANGASAGSKSLIFDDELIETSSVFRQFLSLICYARFDDGYWLPTAQHLVSFLKKWGCDVPLRNLANIIKLDALASFDEISPLRAFAVLSNTGQAFDCREILRLCDFGPFTYEDEDENSEVFSQYGGNSLSPDEWPLYMHIDVPPTYAWALARAYGDHPNTKGVPGEEFAKSFRDWHELAEGTAPTHVGCQLLREPGWR